MSQRETEGLSLEFFRSRFNQREQVKRVYYSENSFLFYRLVRVPGYGLILGTLYAFSYPVLSFVANEIKNSCICIVLVPVQPVIFFCYCAATGTC